MSRTRKNVPSESEDNDGNEGHERDREVILYKNDKRVVMRKPKHVRDFIAFSTSSQESLSKVKTFLRYVVCDVRDINFLKNQLCFLINDCFERLGKDPKTDITIDIDKGIIFYVWVFLPFNYNLKVFETPRNIREDIFAFDLFFVRQQMNSSEIKRILDILKNQLDIHVGWRKFNEPAKLPYRIKAVF